MQDFSDQGRTPATSSAHIPALAGQTAIPREHDQCLRIHELRADQQQFVARECVGFAGPRSSKRGAATSQSFARSQDNSSALTIPAAGPSVRYRWDQGALELVAAAR